MLSSPRARPSSSLALATWTSLWVSTPTITRVPPPCAMLSFAIALLPDRGEVRWWTDRAGGQHCDGAWSQPPIRSLLVRLVPFRRSRTRTDRSKPRHEAGPKEGQIRACDRPADGCGIAGLDACAGVPDQRRRVRHELLDQAGDEVHVSAIRQIVATEGTPAAPWRLPRWTAIVWAPASRP